MQILARYSDIGRYSKVEAQAHYHQEGITMWITWYMAKFARESIAILVNNAFKTVQQSAKDKEDTCRRADARQRYLTQDFTF